ncbi:unnamed protein product [Brachionus calyciflorus]|uniref:D-glucuronyl C5-epimerase C-terminal domain-containing protein n=1 Tax=Brachionus calyciflorus TaxID=104777 RepID=A0A813VL70_9BILA|nr:unnamed protein product [Brachionus calyciflorus]
MNNRRFGLFQIILFLITISTVFFVLLSLNISLDTNPIQFYSQFNSNESYIRPKYNARSTILDQIDCVYDKKLKTAVIPCLKSQNGTSFYVPIDFVRKKFDINGKFEDNSYIIEFSDSKVFHPIVNYDAKKEFLWFKNINVESRDRVKYISLRETVPISSQWNKSGHFYPIQIAQYGLSHFSKFCASNNSELLSTRYFDIKQNNNFVFSENRNSIIESLSNGFEFRFQERSIYKTNYSFDIRYLSADIYTNSTFNLTIDLMLRDPEISNGSHIIHLTYLFDSLNKTKSEYMNTILNIDNSYTILFKVNGLERDTPLKFIRNLCIDSCKALKINCENCLKSLNETMLQLNGSVGSNLYKIQYYKVYQIGLIGEGKILNGILSEKSPSFELAKISADFLVSNQNIKTGGWQINITRKFVSNSNKIILNSGWYSSMAQGHSISLLCRLYSQTQSEKYYQSAKLALNLFEIDSDSNGIRSHFMNSSFVWYEEYPTKPKSLFVLNGFIYSMLGLNDFLNGCYNLKDIETFSKAKNLFINGLNSLVTLINLFDTGTRTFYDLGHLNDPEIYPNIARWDYHSLHVSQLKYLVNILKNLDDNFDRTLMNEYANKLKIVADRWENYMNGVWFRNSQVKD